MFEELALKLYLNDIPYPEGSEEKARVDMERHGYMPLYLQLAEKLSPVFQECYHDGMHDGVVMVENLLAHVVIDDPDPKIQAGAEVYSAIVDIAINACKGVVADDDSEISSDELLEALINVATTR